MTYIETKKINDVLLHTDANTLVAFDLDDTLMQATQYVGSITWEKHMTAHFQKEGFDKQEAKKKVCKIWRKLQAITSVKTVEPDTLKVLALLQEKNIQIMGLTARRPEVLDSTIKQLNSINLSLNANPLHPEEILFDNSACYVENVLYLGQGKNKGETFVNFLKKINHVPQKVLFVDDARHHCEHVSQALFQENIPCTCIHYTAAQQQYASFSPARVHDEFETFVGKDQYKKILEEI